MDLDPWIAQTGLERLHLGMFLRNDAYRMAEWRLVIPLVACVVPILFLLLQATRVFNRLELGERFTAMALRSLITVLSIQAAILGLLCYIQVYGISWGFRH